jgi:hypothetical protein
MGENMKLSKESIDKMMSIAKEYYRKPEYRKAVQIKLPFQIDSPEGLQTGKPSDYIVRGIEGEYYICGEKIFNKTYEMEKKRSK